MDKPHQLDTFPVLYLIKGILTLAFSLFFLLYAGMGFFVSGFSALENQAMNGSAPPFNPGWIFLIVGSLGFVITIVFGILTLRVRTLIQQRKNHQFIFVVAILQCLTGVLGILLGIFTILELQKPEVKALFDEKTA
jgi:hypothetical protein